MDKLCQALELRHLPRARPSRAAAASASPHAEGGEPGPLPPTTSSGCCYSASDQPLSLWEGLSTFGVLFTEKSQGDGWCGASMCACTFVRCLFTPKVEL